MLPSVCKLTATAGDEIRNAMEAMNLSARGYDRILRVARTIADLAGKDSVDRDCALEAISFRQMDTENGNSFWA